MKQKGKRAATWRKAPEERRPAPSEWVGGRVSLPIYVNGKSPSRPDMIAWIAGGAPVAIEAVSPGASDEEVAEMLLDLLDRPALPAPPPRTLRVASSVVAGILRESILDDIRVVVGPTPELASASADLAKFVQTNPRHDDDDGLEGASYLSGGLVSPEDVGALFEAAARLYRAAPWDVVHRDTDALALDIPSLGITGKCISIIGQQGIERAVMIHASFKSFRACNESLKGGSKTPGPMLAIAFTAREDLPEVMVEEADRHQWKVAEDRIYPTLLSTDEDGVPRPITAEDARLARLAAAALARFFEKHRSLHFRSGAPLVEHIEMEDLPSPPTAVVRVPFPESPRSAAVHAPAPKRITSVILRRAVGGTWLPEFARRHRGELQEAADEVISVLEEVADDPRRAFEDLGSLSIIWAACFRPMSGGRSPLAEARTMRALASSPLQAALDRLARARGAFMELLGLDLSALQADLRDLHDGVRYRVRLDRPFASQLTRHMRFFGVLVDLGDGTWEFPSTLASYAGLLDLTPEAFLAEARKALSRLGEDPGDIDSAAPHAGLAKWAGPVAAQLRGLRLPAPAAPKKKRAVTSEGHLVRPQKALLRLPREAERALFRSEADDLRVLDGEIVFVDRTLITLYPQGETIGGIQRRSGGLELDALSHERFMHLLGRVEALAGARPEIASHEEITLSARGLGDVVSDEPGEDVEDLVIGTSLPIPAGDAGATPYAYVMQHLRREIDRDIAGLGGVPRALVATSEGRKAVSEWLRQAEIQGVPGRAAARYLDLDPIRAELGLPTIAESLAR